MMLHYQIFDGAVMSGKKQGINIYDVASKTKTMLSAYSYGVQRLANASAALVDSHRSPTGEAPPMDAICMECGRNWHAHAPDCSVLQVINELRSLEWRWGEDKIVKEQNQGE